jgi:threonine/homoserine/homoserine lactone efflux protein
MIEGGFFVKGLVIGFSIAAPVGPIGVLCIRRTLADGRATGLACGLGAACADALYGCIAAFGLSMISAVLVSQQLWLGLIGGAFLVYLGIRTFVSRPAEQAATTQGGAGLLAACASTFVLTLTNPATILSFAAIFAGLGIASAGTHTAAVVMVAGVFLGSALWWLLLSGGVSVLRNRFDQGAMAWVNRLSGVIIGGFGFFALITALR